MLNLFSSKSVGGKGKRAQMGIRLKSNRPISRRYGGEVKQNTLLAQNVGSNLLNTGRCIAFSPNRMRETQRCNLSDACKVPNHVSYAPPVHNDIVYMTKKTKNHILFANAPLPQPTRSEKSTNFNVHLISFKSFFWQKQSQNAETILPEIYFFRYQCMLIRLVMQRLRTPSVILDHLKKF